MRWKEVKRSHRRKRRTNKCRRGSGRLEGGGKRPSLIQSSWGEVGGRDNGGDSTEPEDSVR